MGTMALNERVLGGAGNGNSQPRLSFSSNGSSSSSSPTQSESTEQQTLDTLSQYIKYLFPSVAFLTLILLDNQPGRLWEVKQAGGKGLGVFAIQLIKKGTIIFQEVPLIQGARIGWTRKLHSCSFLKLRNETSWPYTTDATATNRHAKKQHL
jgi:hypothetical protein